MSKDNLAILAGFNEEELILLEDTYKNLSGAPTLYLLLDNQKEMKIQAYLFNKNSNASYPLKDNASKICTTKYPVIFFSCKDNSVIYKFIDTYKTIDSRRAIYASRTDSNIKWTFANLFTEVEKDHNHVLEKEGQTNK